MPHGGAHISSTNLTQQGDAYELSFGGVPFLLDRSQGNPEAAGNYPDDQVPADDIVTELHRLLPPSYWQDFVPQGDYPGPHLGSLGYAGQSPQPTPQVRIGDWFYPNTASRWSVFRGLATSRQAKAMLAQTGGFAPAALKMRCHPIMPGLPGVRPNATGPVLGSLSPGVSRGYTVQSSMYMLPPRPLAEHGGGYDGLYLITCVDARYYWQFVTANLVVSRGVTWNDLIQQIATRLGVSIGFVNFTHQYQAPEPDSQLWAHEESAPLLLDAIAAQGGLVATRQLDGSVKFYDALQSQALANENRGLARTNREVRAAGGEYFHSGRLLPLAGDLRAARNAVVPNQVRVTFPKYVLGDDPVPHYLNPRYAPGRPPAWTEERPEEFSLTVPVTSGSALTSGDPVTSGLVGALSGLVGTAFTATVKTNVRAYYSGEVQATSGTPLNASGLQAYAERVAGDYYQWQASAALDEVFAGTYTWYLEGQHDVLWTYAAGSRGGFTHVIRSPWNRKARELHAGGCPPSGYGPTVVPAQGTLMSGWLAGPWNPPGVGGKSVAQAWKDVAPWSGYVSDTIGTTLAAPLESGTSTALFYDVDNMPTHHRWKGVVGREIILFEATSGGVASSVSGVAGFLVNIVHRAIDGSANSAHAAGVSVYQPLPQAQYGVNLVETGKMQWLHPGAWTSGGVQGVRLVPQTQTLRALAGSGQAIVLNGRNHYDGTVLSYDTTIQTNNFQTQESCWMVERNNTAPILNNQYDGQFAGYSTMIGSGSFSGTPCRPVYLFNAGEPGEAGPPGSGGVTQLLTVQEVDLSPIVSGTVVLEFDQDDGFVVSNPRSGVARVDLISSFNLTVRKSDLSAVLSPVTVAELYTPNTNCWSLVANGLGVARMQRTLNFYDGASSTPITTDTWSVTAYPSHNWSITGTGSDGQVVIHRLFYVYQASSTLHTPNGDAWVFDFFPSLAHWQITQPVTGYVTIDRVLQAHVAGEAYVGQSLFDLTFSPGSPFQCWRVTNDGLGTATIVREFVVREHGTVRTSGTWRLSFESHPSMNAAANAWTVSGTNGDAQVQRNFDVFEGGSQITANTFKQTFNATDFDVTGNGAGGSATVTTEGFTGTMGPFYRYLCSTSGSQSGQLVELTWAGFHVIRGLVKSGTAAYS